MSPYADTYNEVTERILKALDEGVAPWRQPWQTLSPVNVRSGKPYRGINPLLLSLAGPYSDQRWGTFKAWREIGGHVRRGEHGTRIVFWKRVAKKNAAELEARGEASHYSLLRSYVVFNGDQVDDIAAPAPREVFNPSKAAQAVIDGYPAAPSIAEGGDAAYYVPSKDHVQLPSRDLFSDSAAWYAVAFHELTHSAGADKRCGGLVPATFGSDPYAREELVAEIGAAMLGASCDLGVSLETSAAYLQGWREAISEDPRLIVSAAAAAQRRADHIRGISFAAEDNEEGGSRNDASFSVAA